MVSCIFAGEKMVSVKVKTVLKLLDTFYEDNKHTAVKKMLDESSFYNQLQSDHMTLCC